MRLWLVSRVGSHGLVSQRQTAAGQDGLQILRY